MNIDDLRSVQTPLKERYRSEPDSALITLKADGRIGDHITCSIQTDKALVEAGLHPATGGSGDVLLEALAGEITGPRAVISLQTALQALEPFIAEVSGYL